MSFDTWSVAAVADELTEVLLGGRVQQIIQPDEDSLGLEVYAQHRRHYLLASAQTQAPRLHLVSNKLRRGVDTPSPLLQLMRKFVRGATLLGITQPRWERILHLRFDHPEHGESLLVAELIGRWANLLLLRPAKHERPSHDLTATKQALEAEAQVARRERLRILDSIRRFPPREDAMRVVLPGQLYAPPPTQEGWSPDTLTELKLQLLLEEAASAPETPLWRILLYGLQGLSPQVAREIVFRATGQAQSTVADLERLTPVVEMVSEFVDILDEGRWAPCLVIGEGDRPLAFAPYALQHRANLSGGGLFLAPLASISAAVERFYATTSPVVGSASGVPQSAAGVAPLGEPEEDPYRAARRQVANAIERARRNLERRQKAITREIRPPEEVELLRISANWILALATQIDPQQAELSLPNGSGVPADRVTLDPSLSAADNAAVYFRRYRKRKRAREKGEERLNEIAAELEYLEQLATDLDLAGDRSEIDAVRTALIQAGYGRQPSGKAPALAPEPARPRRFHTNEGFPILVGRNSRQNEQVTFQLASPDDLWLHARGYAGSHVVIRNAGRAVSEESLQQAATLAAYYSKARHEAWVNVIVATRRHVRRARGKRPGMVTVSEERVLRVRPLAPEGA